MAGGEIPQWGPNSNKNKKNPIPNSNTALNSISITYNYTKSKGTLEAMLPQQGPKSSWVPNGGLNMP